MSGRLLLVVMVFLALLNGCGDSGGSSNPNNPPVNLPSKPVGPEDLHFTTVTNEVFTPKCYKCHNRANGVTNGGIGLDTLIEVRANSAKIYQAAILEKRMPKNDTLTTRQYNLLKAWLEAGSPEWEELESMYNEF
ncbi:hypothetical protein [Bdellovibrio reynosensis]|uniref:Cytochrome c domain-containing protein n=1 Tax=Bdellovibrio reynosensis TaxID=2835041 RepID=A0ABY4C8P7_9BACT|nr:hypothetical protein [Bdellovibrio reynosensis]UOF01302.1 hypothetical protein MNR06_16530 [Bdellovibrio reynosensis]